MSYATNDDRLALINSTSSMMVVPFVVRFEKNSRQSELVADDIDHALNIQKSWIDKGASYVEIFRVMEHDGSINPTIGAYRSS